MTKTATKTKAAREPSVITQRRAMLALQGQAWSVIEDVITILWKSGGTLRAIKLPITVSLLHAQRVREDEWASEGRKTPWPGLVGLDVDGVTAMAAASEARQTYRQVIDLESRAGLWRGEGDAVMAIAWAWQAIATASFDRARNQAAKSLVALAHRSERLAVERAANPIHLERPVTRVSAKRPRSNAKKESRA